MTPLGVRAERSEVSVGPFMGGIVTPQGRRVGVCASMFAMADPMFGYHLLPCLGT